MRFCLSSLLKCHNARARFASRKGSRVQRRNEPPWERRRAPFWVMAIRHARNIEKRCVPSKILDVRVLPHRTPLLTGVSCEQNCVFRVRAYVACVKRYNIKSTRASNLPNQYTQQVLRLNALKKYKLGRGSVCEARIGQALPSWVIETIEGRSYDENKIFLVDRI